MNYNEAKVISAEINKADPKSYAQFWWLGGNHNNEYAIDFLIGGDTFRLIRAADAQEVIGRVKRVANLKRELQQI
jgi:hypothetical protein